MKLYVSPRAPSPRRVLMFLVEKNITGIDLVHIDLNAHEHKREAYLAKSPLAKVPALELDDGRVLTETRAICTYLEGLYPEPNLMGVDFDERAFIEMTDRRVELYLLGSIANTIRHTHPGLAPLEQPQFPTSATPGDQGARNRRLVRLGAGAPALDGRRALHHCRHHRLLCHRIRTRLDEVQAGPRRFERTAGLARPRGRTAERPGVGADAPGVRCQSCRHRAVWLARKKAPRR
jgi:glutathione S-transferase